MGRRSRGQKVAHKRLATCVVVSQQNPSNASNNRNCSSDHLIHIPVSTVIEKRQLSQIRLCITRKLVREQGTGHDMNSTYVVDERQEETKASKTFSLGKTSASQIARSYSWGNAQLSSIMVQRGGAARVGSDTASQS